MLSLGRVRALQPPGHSACRTSEHTCLQQGSPVLSLSELPKAHLQNGLSAPVPSSEGSSTRLSPPNVSALLDISLPGPPEDVLSQGEPATQISDSIIEIAISSGQFGRNVVTSPAGSRFGHQQGDSDFLLRCPAALAGAVPLGLLLLRTGRWPLKGAARLWPCWRCLRLQIQEHAVGSLSASGLHLLRSKLGIISPAQGCS